VETHRVNLSKIYLSGKHPGKVMGRGRDDKAMEFMGAAFILVVGLYVVAVMVQQFASQSQLFANMMYGGGVLAAIVAGAVAILKVRERR
jgi:hypothetical protein